MGSQSIVVFSYGSQCEAALHVVAECGLRTVGVVLPSNRRNSQVEVARSAAVRAGTPVLEQPPRASAAEFAAKLRALEPDLALVWSYTMLLPREVIAAPRAACVNLHGGLLPQYRGGHVMQWAIINGETETGVTLHHVEEKIDAGAVIDEERCAIDEADYAADVARKLQSAGERLLRRCLPSLAAGTAESLPQCASASRYYPLRTPADGEIDWSLPAGAVRRLVRAVSTPWPGAFARLGDAILVVHEADAILRPHASAPGTMLEVTTDGIIIACGCDALLVRRWEWAANITRKGSDSIPLVFQSRVDYSRCD